MNRQFILGIAVASLAVFVYASVLVPMLRPLISLPELPGAVPVRTFAILIFSIGHAIFALGWRHALAFFAITAVVSWGYEQVGVATGLIYGNYYYTDALGPKLGHVPLLIPLAWFMMIYPSYVIANLIAHDHPTGSPGGLWRLLWLAFLSGMVMTAWDLVVDPFLTSGPHAAWVWVDGGPYFGIPVQNFVGWLVTTFTIYLIYRLMESWRPPIPMGRLSRWIVVLPLIAYGAMMFVNSFEVSPQAMHVIGPFVMGLPLVMALTRLTYYRVPSAVPTPRAQRPSAAYDDLATSVRIRQS